MGINYTGDVMESYNNKLNRKSIKYERYIPRNLKKKHQNECSILEGKKNVLCNKEKEKSKIKREKLLKKIEINKKNVRKHPLYLSAKNEVKILNRNQIKNLQRNIGAKPDGQFGPNTFLKHYNNSDPNISSKSLTELANLDIKFDNIKDSINSGNKSKLLNTFKNIRSGRNKKLYALKVKEYISENELFKQARKLFVIQQGKSLSFDFGNKALESKLSAYELFGDKPYLKKGKRIYLNDYRSKFIRYRNNQRLSIWNSTKLSYPDESIISTKEKNNMISNKNGKIKRRKRELENKEILKEGWLGGEFAKWIGEKAKLIGGKNVCGKGTMGLISKFLTEKFEGKYNLYPQGQRNGTNLDTMLVGDISKENPFVGTNKRKYYSLNKIKERYGIDIQSVIENLPVTFKKIRINNPWEAKEGDILIYNEGAKKGSNERKIYGHAEVVGADKKFYSYYSSINPAGSSRMPRSFAEKNPEKYREKTGFTYALRMFKK